MIWNRQQVVDRVKQKTNCKVPLKSVSLILKNRLGLTYGKLKRIESNANILKCLILRQQSGQKIIELLKQGIRFINIDETWINQKDFRRKSWRKYNKSNSIGVKAVSPRISFMVAFDTEGDIFYSLT